MSPLYKGENLAERLGFPRRVGIYPFSRIVYIALSNVTKEEYRVPYLVSQEQRLQLFKIYNFVRKNHEYFESISGGFKKDGAVINTIATFDEWSSRHNEHLRRVQDAEARLVAIELEQENIKRRRRSRAGGH